jgi:hypothetical protein
MDGTSERLSRREFLRRGGAAAFALPLLPPLLGSDSGAAQRRLLYVAVPGIRNYLEWGGSGVLVYDIDAGYELVRRIPTLEVPAGGEAENVKGVCASAATGRLYVSTIARLLCLDLSSGALLWNRTYLGGCDRMSITPDGSTLYLPSLEGPHWHVVDGASGDVLGRLEMNSGAHNTIVGLDGRFTYLAGLNSPLLPVVDTRTRQVVRRVGPFSKPIRPFTLNGAQSLVFVNVNELLGFEVGDLRTGKMLHRVEVKGFQNGPVKRHGCPSHGIGLTPDERELWLSDGPNSNMHVFDATVMPPRQTATIPLRDQPGWVTFSLDGKHAYPSTGEIIDTKTKRIVATLKDEKGGPVQSEKLLEVITTNGRPTRTGDQFGLGRKGIRAR